MPATEETWYNQKLLHLIFGCTSLLMLIAVVWMIAQDHEREWKNHQREFRSIQEKQLRGRMAAEEKLAAEVVAQAEMQLAEAESELPSKDLIEQFKGVAQNVGEFSFDGSDEAYQELEVVSGTVSGAFKDYNDTEVKIREARAAVSSASDDAAKQAANVTLRELQDSLASIKERLGSVRADASKLRGKVLRPLEKIEALAKYQMDSASGAKKLATANFNAQTGTQGLMYGKEQFAAADAMQEEIDTVYKTRLDEATAEAERTTANRNQLRSLLGKINQNTAGAAKKLDEARSEQKRLAAAIDEVNVEYFSLTTVLGKKLLELPVVDGFGGPLKIDNLWTDGLTMPNGSFGEVRRFDRCTTCHKGIDKTAPGAPFDPAYEERHQVVLQLTTPAEPAVGTDPTVEDVYGITLAKEGFVDRNDIAVEFIASQSLAATAVNTSDSACASGLLEGDVLRYIGGNSVDSPREAIEFLLDPPNGWDSSVEVIVERGLPQPYTSHPRLDLYVGSLSPHKMTDIGCTVCHEGDGSGTSFNYSSHTPDSLEQEDQWWKEYGWFNNHHWIYPMHPARFAESSCLKCHHDVVELDASDRFPETPAPKLLAGHNLIKAYGCFGCHEMNGYKSPTERIGPDLRLEPNYFAAAAELAHDSSFQKMPEEAQQAALRLVQHPYDNSARHELLAMMDADAASEEPVLSASAAKLAEVLGDTELPGELRKVGPSLRHVSSKLSPTFLYDWIREPKHFRPTTKMPQFFGMWDHIQDDEKALELAQRYEPIEIMGIVTYLMDRSQPMLGEIEPATGVEAADIERGKVAFETRGCLACHQHEAYDDANHSSLTAQPRPGVSRQIQGPDLTNIGDKFSVADTPDTKKWLYTWLRNPQLYHPRTKMPDLYLTPDLTADGKMLDPAADIAAFLMSSSNGWQPADAKLNPSDEDVREVALEYLKKAFFKTEAEKYIAEGIPEEIAATLKGSEVELANVAGSSGDMKKKLLNYVGAKSIGKYGCYGCHDIPGYEAAKPIGVALADWGRKDPSKIAFEHIAEYISHGHAGGGHGGDHGDGHADAAMHDDGHGHGEGEIDEHFYTHRLEHHDRTGFIWQKLKEPRSYDYKKVLNKDYNEKLRMPMFPFTDVQREQVITFILGLVAEPPAEKFVYRPDDRQEALIAGKKVLDKYNCAGCHVLDTEKWDIEYRRDERAISIPNDGFDFAKAHLATDSLTSSDSPHRQTGTLSARVEGMPTLSESGHPQLFEYEPEDIDDSAEFEIGPDYDYDNTPLMRSLTLWKPAALQGETAEVSAILQVFPSAIKNRYKPTGGDLAMRLLPRVMEIAREKGTSVPVNTAWGWLPPPLHKEGAKVQPEWLHSFLLEPHMIRPGAVMRMPKFNMSPAEATAVVNYFAARDGASYPYEYEERTSPELLKELDAQYTESGGSDSRLESAMGIVTSGTNGCVKCHVFGDYVPGGSLVGQVARAGNTAPNLANVYTRLRRDYIRPWIANPQSVLPYTPMNAVIPHKDPSIWNGALKGTPTEQLDGVVDLLMNFDRYSREKSSIKGMVKVDAPAETASAN